MVNSNATEVFSTWKTSLAKATRLFWNANIKSIESQIIIIKEFVKKNIFHSTLKGFLFKFYFNMRDKNLVYIYSLKGKQQETLFYQIEYQNDRREAESNRLQTIAQLFTLIESHKEGLQIETYSLSQTNCLNVKCFYLLTKNKSLKWKFIYF